MKKNSILWLLVLLSQQALAMEKSATNEQTKISPPFSATESLPLQESLSKSNIPNEQKKRSAESELDQEIEQAKKRRFDSLRADESLDEHLEVHLPSVELVVPQPVNPTKIQGTLSQMPEAALKYNKHQLYKIILEKHSLCVREVTDPDALIIAAELNIEELVKSWCRLHPEWLTHQNADNNSVFNFCQQNPNLDKWMTDFIVTNRRADVVRFLCSEPSVHFYLEHLLKTTLSQKNQQKTNWLISIIKERRIFLESKQAELAEFLSRSHEQQSLPLQESSLKLNATTEQKKRAPESEFHEETPPAKRRRLESLRAEESLYEPSSGKQGSEIYPKASVEDLPSASSVVQFFPPLSREEEPEIVPSQNHEQRSFPLQETSLKPNAFEKATESALFQETPPTERHLDSLQSSDKMDLEIDPKASEEHLPSAETVVQFFHATTGEEEPEIAPSPAHEQPSLVQKSSLEANTTERVTESEPIQEAPPAPSDDQQSDKQDSHEFEVYLPSFAPVVPRPASPDEIQGTLPHMLEAALKYKKDRLYKTILKDHPWCVREVTDPDALVRAAELNIEELIQSWCTLHPEWLMHKNADDKCVFHFCQHNPKLDEWISNFIVTHNRTDVVHFLSSDPSVRFYLEHLLDTALTQNNQEKLNWFASIIKEPRIFLRAVELKQVELARLLSHYHPEFLQTRNDEGKTPFQMLQDNLYSKLVHLLRNNLQEPFVEALKELPSMRAYLPKLFKVALRENKGVLWLLKTYPEVINIQIPEMLLHAVEHNYEEIIDAMHLKKGYPWLLHMNEHNETVFHIAGRMGNVFLFSHLTSLLTFEQIVNIHSQVSEFLDKLYRGTTGAFRRRLSEIKAFWSKSLVAQTEDSIARTSLPPRPNTEISPTFPKKNAEFVSTDQASAHSAESEFLLANALSSDLTEDTAAHRDAPWRLFEDPVDMPFEELSVWRQSIPHAELPAFAATDAMDLDHYQFNDDFSPLYPDSFEMGVSQDFEPESH